jgi:integrase/recombinase XerD
MTPLRQRLIEDMQLRNLAPETIRGYVYYVARFAKYFGRSPELLTPEHARQYQLHLLEKKVSWSTFNQSVCALRFFYGTTLGRKDYVKRLPFGKKPKRVPVVLSREEVLKFLQGMGRVRQATAQRTGTGAEVPGSLYLSRGDQQ